MKKFFIKILLWFAALIGAYLAAIAVTTFLNDQEFGLNLGYATETMTVFITVLLSGILLLVRLFKLMDGKGNKKKGFSDKGKDKTGKEVEQYFSNDFVTVDELRSKKDFNFCTLRNIRSSKDGVLVRAERMGTNMEINFIKPIHTLIIGTTSSGKSTQYIIPTLQILSMTASKPSFVITDPKKELYEENVEKLKAEGYTILRLDLDNPYGSSHWNPLTYAYRTYHRSLNINREVKIHQPGEDPRLKKLLMDSNFDWHTTTWYEFNRTAYADRNNLDRDLSVVRDKLQSAAFTEIQDVVTAIAPVVNTNDANWETCVHSHFVYTIQSMEHLFP